MDMTKVKYFSVVAETGSIRKAAELLDVSAPAVSRAVTQLETLDSRLLSSRWNPFGEAAFGG